MDLGDHQHIGHGHRRKGKGHVQQQNAHNDAGRLAIELGNGCDEAAIAHLLEANGLYDRVQGLKEVNEEEDHKVEARIVAEGLVRRSEPFNRVLGMLC